MKKFALALMTAAAVTFGFGGVANANSYPPGGESVTTSDSTTEPGGQVTVTANCTLGETVTFTLLTSVDTDTCSVESDNQAVGGIASGTVTAPVAPGTYTGTVTGTVSGDLGSFTVVVAGQTDDDDDDDDGDTPAATVPAGGLPATGSDGIGATTGIAIGLLVVGVGLFAVATVRRRQPGAA